jgi:(5-formylfuran-3-yl)methyl phosphate synthase
MSTTPGLLVSVRSKDEVAAALSGGADLIDVKEPAKGPLAPAEAEVVAAVIDAVKGKVPVSAALGEWSPNAITDAHWHLELKLNYVKWGLAGYTPAPGWGEDLLDTRRELPVGMEMVAVAYADWERAKSVPPAEVVKFAKRFRFKAFLLDTWGKDGKTLLDFLKPDEVTELVESLKRLNIIVAVGGSLRPEHAKQLMKTVAPDYFAVRSSVCAAGKRDGVIDAARVKKWKETIG